MGKKRKKPPSGRNGRPGGKTVNIMDDKRGRQVLDALTRMHCASRADGGASRFRRQNTLNANLF